ncbi:hypothetical protein TWF281_007183 [Arthrobotrys megalospora]
MPKPTQPVPIELELEALDRRNNEAEQLQPQYPELARDPEAQPPPTPLPPFFPLLTDLTYSLTHPHFLAIASYILPTLPILAATAYLYSPPRLFSDCTYDLFENPGPFLTCVYTSVTDNFTSSNPIFLWSTTFLVVGITSLGLLTWSLCIIHDRLVQNLLPEQVPAEGIITAMVVMVGVYGLVLTMFSVWIGWLPIETAVAGVVGRAVWRSTMGIYTASKDRFRRYRTRA